MRVISESKLYVATTSNGFEIGLYTESNTNTWPNLKAKPNWICSGKCNGDFFQEIQKLRLEVWDTSTLSTSAIMRFSGISFHTDRETKINLLAKSNIKHKAFVYKNSGFLKISFDDADNLIKALQIIEKTSDPKERFKENILEKVTDFIYKNQELNEISNYSIVSKKFRRFFTREKFFGGKDILGLPEGCVTIIEFFLAHQSNLSFFKEQIRTCGLKGKISELIPEDSFTITINPHNISKIDPKNNPNIIIKFQNDTHAQLIASKLMLHIYHPKTLYRPVRNSTILKISDPGLLIAKKIGAGKYNNILFPKQSYKSQRPRIDRSTARRKTCATPLGLLRLPLFSPVTFLQPLHLGKLHHFDQTEMDTTNTQSSENGQSSVIFK